MFWLPVARRCSASTPTDSDEGTATHALPGFTPTARTSLKLLELGLVHIAGVHLADSDHPDAHVQAARQAVPGQRSVLVNLAQWRQGLVVAPGNPLEYRRSGSGLLRPEAPACRARCTVRPHSACSSEF